MIIRRTRYRLCSFIEKKHDPEGIVWCVVEKLRSEDRVIWMARWNPREGTRRERRHQYHFVTYKRNGNKQYIRMFKLQAYIMPIFNDVIDSTILEIFAPRSPKRGSINNELQQIIFIEEFVFENSHCFFQSQWPEDNRNNTLTKDFVFLLSKGADAEVSFYSKISWQFEYGGSSLKIIRTFL